MTSSKTVNRLLQPNKICTKYAQCAVEIKTSGANKKSSPSPILLMILSAVHNPTKQAPRHKVIKILRRISATEEAAQASKPSQESEPPP
jgi:hypothetical protein